MTYRIWSKKYGMFTDDLGYPSGTHVISEYFVDSFGMIREILATEDGVAEINLVDREDFVVQRGTGVASTDGREIYEGDIVTYLFGRKFRVEWGEDQCGFIIRDLNPNPRNQSYASFNCDVAFESKVIGNVFDLTKT